MKLSRLLKPTLPTMDHKNVSNVRSVIGKIAGILDGSDTMIDHYLSLKPTFRRTNLRLVNESSHVTIYGRDSKISSTSALDSKGAYVTWPGYGKFNGIQTGEKIII
jgi:hypothetical protein